MTESPFNEHGHYIPGVERNWFRYADEATRTERALAEFDREHKGRGLTPRQAERRACLQAAVLRARAEHAIVKRETDRTWEYERAVAFARETYGDPNELI